MEEGDLTILIQERGRNTKIFGAQYLFHPFRLTVHCDITYSLIALAELNYLTELGIYRDNSFNDFK